MDILIPYWTLLDKDLNNANVLAVDRILRAADNKANAPPGSTASYASISSRPGISNV